MYDEQNQKKEEKKRHYERTEYFFLLQKHRGKTKCGEQDCLKYKRKKG